MMMNLFIMGIGAFMLIPNVAGLRVFGIIFILMGFLTAPLGV